MLTIVSKKICSLWSSWANCWRWDQDNDYKYLGIFARYLYIRCTEKYQSQRFLFESLIFITCLLSSEPTKVNSDRDTGPESQKGQLSYEQWAQFHSFAPGARMSSAGSVRRWLQFSTFILSICKFCMKYVAVLNDFFSNKLINI